MKYNQPIGAAEGASYIDGNPGLGIEGSPVPAAAIEAAQREIVNVLVAAGLTPTLGDNTQLAAAILAIAGSSTRLKAKGTTIASSATTNIGGADSDFVEISGTTTITSFGSGTAFNRVWLKFQGIVTITHHATSLIMPNGQNYVTSAGAIIEMARISGSNWQCMSIRRADGKAVYESIASDTTVGGVELATVAEAKAGTDTSRAVTPEGLLAALGLPLIEAKDITVAQSTVDFTTGINSTYEQYMLVGTNVKVTTDAVAAWLRFSQAGSFISSSTYSHRSIGNVDTAATPVGGGNGGDSKINICPSGLTVGNNSLEQMNFVIFISNPAGDLPKHIQGIVSHIDASGGLVGGEISGSFYGTPATAVDGIRIMASSSTIKGKFKLYGIRKA